MATLLVVSHCPSDNAVLMREAVLAGARHPDAQGVVVRSLAPLEAGPNEVLGADGLILGTTENFGDMAGRLKDFFERIYYPCLEETQGRPWAMFIKAGNDGIGAQTGIRRIVQGLRWKEVQPPVLCVGPPQEHHLDDCKTLGLTLAAGLEAGIF